ncbi:hypothetical protein MTR_7g061740 [Medicago truncatula]|uniref:Uncharacterized protein n=1 Tax=Medicago truncatula TaxID=3880 RepID=A0A072U189_MEDTR|nr:hypothetical protein MTR_7g061740 [Medicago truncatula]
MITIEERILIQVHSRGELWRDESELSQRVSRKSGQGPLLDEQFQGEKLEQTRLASNTSHIEKASGTRQGSSIKNFQAEDLHSPLGLSKICFSYFL